MIEFASDDFSLAGVVIEVLPLARDLEVTGASKVAVDPLFINNRLDAVDGRERSGSAQFATSQPAESSVGQTLTLEEAVRRRCRR